MESTSKMLAAMALESYAKDMEGFTHQECLELSEASLGGGYDDYIANHQCELLEGALGEGIGGEITCEEIGSLLDSGFSAEFVKGLAGEDGTKAIRARAKWLGNRFDISNGTDEEDLTDAAAAVVALEAMGPYSAEALSFLLSALKDEGMQVRTSAVRAIGHAGPAASGALPELVVLLDSGDAELTREVARAIAGIGHSGIDYLVGALDHWNRDVKMAVIAALGSAGPQAKGAVPRIIEILEGLEDLDESEKPFSYRCVENESIRALGSIGDERAVPVLIELSRYRNSLIRHLAVEALGDIGSSKAGAALKRAFRDKEPDVREAAFSSILSIRPPWIISALKRALRDEEHDIREAAFSSILSIRPPWIISALEYAYRNRIGFSYGSSPFGSWRTWNVELGRLLDPGQAFSFYSRLLSSTDEVVRCEAARELGATGSDRALSPLIGALRDRSPHVRECAANALGMLGPTAARAAGPLRAALEDEERVAISAAQVLGGIGDRASIPHLLATRLVSRQSHAMSKRVYQSLAMYNMIHRTAQGMLDRDALPHLIRALRSPDWRIALGAVNGLAHMGEEAAEALPALVAALRHRDPDVRREAVSAISAIGPKEAIGPLKRALEDRCYWVVKDAAWVLEAAAGLGREEIAGLLSKALERGCNSPSTAMAFLEYSPDLDEDTRVRLVPAIARGLRSKNIWTRDRAAELLGSLGPAADAAVPWLVRAILGARGEERTDPQAMWSLGGIGTESAVKALIKFARGSNPNVKEVAIRALRTLRSKPPEVISILVAVVAAMDGSANYPDESILIDVLGKAGSAAVEALPVLEGIMRNVKRSGETRIQAARVYKEISGETPLSIWRDLRNDRDDAVRRKAQAIIY